MLNLVILNLPPSGFNEGRKAWLRPGQTLVMGSGPMADLAIPDDGGVETMHCEMTCERERCTVRSSSEGRVLLNDAPITSATVRDGDRLTLGTTTLTVQLEQREKPPVEPAPNPAAANTDEARPEPHGTVAENQSGSPDTILSTALDRWLS